MAAKKRSLVEDAQGYITLTEAVEMQRRKLKKAKAKNKKK